jgi:hypothetical protein
MQQVEVKRTVVSMRDYARAVLKAWKAFFGNLPEKKSVAVLYAQYMIETGGRACWNWNIGNVKHFRGDGFDWVALDNVWEGVAPFAASALIARGEAVLDTNEGHIKAVGASKTSVVFKAGRPETLFRAYPNLDVAMMGHIRFLFERFAPCWTDVVSGDYHGFAHTLKAGRDGKENTPDDYFTAQAEAYATGMAPYYQNFLSSLVFDTELQEVLGTMEAPTLDQLPEDTLPPDSPTLPVEVPEMRSDPLGHVTVHPDVPLGNSFDRLVCTQCGAVNPSPEEDCPQGAEVPGAGTGPHVLA